MINHFGIIPNEGACMYMSIWIDQRCLFFSQIYLINVDLKIKQIMMECYLDEA
jgi:hypothetical protein